MKKKIIILSSLFLLSSCLDLNQNTKNSSNSSSIIDSSNNVTLTSLVINCDNYNKIPEIEVENIEYNINSKYDIFTFKALGTLKTNKIKDIYQVIINVQQTYGYLDVYTNYDGLGTALNGEKVTGDREATYTYDLKGADELCIKNNSDYLTHLRSITIKYKSNEINNGDNTGNSSSNSSSSSSNNTSSSNSSSSNGNNSSSSSMGNNNSSSSSNGNTSKPNPLKEGLKGSEWLEYYGSEYGGSCKSVPSTGNPKMLVVPVLFKNEPIDNSSQVLNDIEVTFNGKSSETSWESVDTFYQKSSYGQLDMDITVLDYWITLDKTCTQLASLDESTYADPTWYALDYVVDYLNSKGMDMKDYDSNGDGFIDGIWMVYGKDYSSASSSQQNIMWAYTYWQYGNKANINNPAANVYAWASVEFMYEGNYSKPDAHTFIHETGHMLGLDDYYDYDEGTSLSPAGCLDMMDYNIGDHNAYSKYLLDWVNPTYITEATTITLNPFESSGDCIVVPTSLSNDMSPMDEYLIIEFYTPTGLNESDASDNYQGDYPMLFTERGIKIYHVDSRIGKLTYSNGDYNYGNYKYNAKYDDLVSGSDSYSYYDIFASNTSSYSYDNDFKKLVLLSSKQNSKNNYYYSNTNASNNDLYQKGDSVTSFKFNKGTSLLFEITIDNITTSSATISFA